ncbi:2-oxoglutarate dehydrogenase E1 component, partial [Massospora cicadina]
CGSKKRPSRNRNKGRRDSAAPLDSYGQINRVIKDYGLIISDVLGDGNCLFRSLSDQIFGTDAYHGQLREEVCEYIEQHSDFFRSFFITDDGDTFEDHLKEMRELGTYGGNHELVAFANKYNVDIHIYQDSSCETLTINGCSLEEEPDAPKKGLVHLAHEHYSSVRNIKGPFEGLPNIDIQRNIKELEERASQGRDVTNSGDEAEYKPSRPTSGKKIRAKVRKIVQNTGYQDTHLIKRMLRENKYSVKVVEDLITSADKACRKASQNTPQRHEPSPIIPQEADRDSAKETEQCAVEEFAVPAASDNSLPGANSPESVCPPASGVEIASCQGSRLEAVGPDEVSPESKNCSVKLQPQLETVECSKRSRPRDEDQNSVSPKPSKKSRHTRPLVNAEISHEPEIRSEAPQPQLETVEVFKLPCSRDDQNLVSFKPSKESSHTQPLVNAEFSPEPENRSEAPQPQLETVESSKPPCPRDVQNLVSPKPSKKSSHTQPLVNAEFSPESESRSEAPQPQLETVEGSKKSRPRDEDQDLVSPRPSKKGRGNYVDRATSP